MSVVVIMPPEPIVSLALAKKHLRVDDDDSDDLIQTYIAAAQGSIDGPDGWLKRAVGVQTLELRRAGFFRHDWPFGLGWSAWDDCNTWAGWSRRLLQVDLPFPPLIEVTSITYEDTAGTDQTISAEGWRATADGVAPIFGSIWPSGRIEANAVRIQYRAGYVTPPAPIVAAVLQMVGGMWGGREDVVVDTGKALVENPTVKRLLAPFRIISV